MQDMKVSCLGRKHQKHFFSSYINIEQYMDLTNNAVKDNIVLGKKFFVFPQNIDNAL